MWGCSTCPDKANMHKFVTAGGDKTIRVYDIAKKSMIKGTKPLEQELRAVDWSPDGKYIVAGDWLGHVYLFDP